MSCLSCRSRASALSIAPAAVTKPLRSTRPAPPAAVGVCQERRRAADGGKTGRGTSGAPQSSSTRAATSVTSGASPRTFVHEHSVRHAPTARQASARVPTQQPHHRTEHRLRMQHSKGACPKLRRGCDDAQDGLHNARCASSSCAVPSSQLISKPAHASPFTPSEFTSTKARRFYCVMQQYGDRRIGGRRVVDFARAAPSRAGCVTRLWPQKGKKRQLTSKPTQPSQFTPSEFTPRQLSSKPVHPQASSPPGQSRVSLRGGT